MDQDLILLSEYCDNSRVELEFVLLLEDEGLIETQIYDNAKYLQSSQLKDLETFSRLHYDLSINIEGIDVINNLLNKVRKMEWELSVLRRQLDMDPFMADDFFDEF